MHFDLQLWQERANDPHGGLMRRIAERGVLVIKPGTDGFDVEDRRGKEGITAADVREGLEVIRWSAVTKPMGLLAGMPVVLSFLRDR